MKWKKNFEFIYSPRTTLSNIKEKEEKMFTDLKEGFDPYTIKIMKKHYKEHLGKLNKETFVSILKRHLLTWYPNIPNRENILIKLLSRLFDEIDLNSNGDLEWDEFANYIINSSYQQNYEHSSYGLQQYSLSKEDFFDHQEEMNINPMNRSSVNKLENIITSCFYIRKHRLIGIIHEGRSKILFFNSINNKKVNLIIDLIETQKEINKLEMKELNEKTKILLEQERQKRLEWQNYFNNDNLNQLKIKNYNKNIQNEKPTNNSNKISTSEFTNKIFEKKDINDTEEIIIDITKYKYNKGLFILTTCYIEEYDLLFISASNYKISAWTYDTRLDGFKNINLINYSSKSDFHFEKDHLDIPLFQANAPQNTLIYDRAYKCLYSGQENGKINKWEMDSPYSTHVFDIYDLYTKNLLENLIKKKIDIIKKEEMLSLDKIKPLYNMNNIDNADIGLEKEEFHKLEQHTKNIASFKLKRDTISYLLLLDKLRLLCSSYLDGKIIIWDPDTKKPIKIFTDQTTAIYSMVFDPKKNQIYTCGFEHEIYIYEPYNNDNATYKLKGHNASVNSLVINPELNELISMDVSGIIKLWDIIAYINIQTINTNDISFLVQNIINNKKDASYFTNKKKLSSNNFLLSYNNPKKILVYGSKQLIFEKGKEKNPNLADDNQLFCCVYNPLSKDLISISSKRVKIWNVYNGKMRKSYDNLMKDNEITSCCFDKQMKRFYLGDNLGKIKCFNLSTGNFIKDFVSHENEITHIIHSAKNELVVSISADLCMKIQQDKELFSTELIKETFIKPGNNYNPNYKMKLNSAVLDDDNSILMLGLSNGVIKYYDVMHLKFYLNPNEEQDNKTKIQTAISNLLDITNMNTLFVANFDGEKFFTPKPKNILYHFFSEEKLGNFFDEDKNDINNNKNIVISSALYSKLYLLITGNQLGMLYFYNIKPLYDFFENINEKMSEKEVKANLNKGINITLKYKVQIHREVIRYINITDELIPEIIISTSNDKKVKLTELKTGKYIETLKQISIKYNPIPIGIKYLKDNPFKPSKNNKKEYNTIYLKDISLPLKKPRIIYEEANQNDIMNHYEEMAEYNAKVQLMKFSKGKNFVEENRSSIWNYKINIKNIMKKKEEELNKIIEMVNEKEDEINEAEIQHQELSLFNDNFNPIFISNLNKEEKNELRHQINMKIRNINLAISKTQTLKKVAESIKEHSNINKSLDKNKISKKEKSKSKNKSKNKNKSLNPIKLLKSKKISKKNDTRENETNTISNEKSLTNKINIKINSPENIKNKKADSLFKHFKLNRPNYLRRSSSYFNFIHNKNDSDSNFTDKRFSICQNEFNIKFKELTSPMEKLLKKNKKQNVLPKISKNNKLLSK